MKTFIKRPIPIAAVQCTKENESDIIQLLRSGTTEYDLITDDQDRTIGFMIYSWEGINPVYYDVTKNKNSNNKPYWIMRGLKNEIYPCVSDPDYDAPLGYEEVK